MALIISAGRNNQSPNQWYRCFASINNKCLSIGSVVRKGTKEEP